MSDERATRLRQSRIKAGYSSAQAAAEAFGWKVSGYRHHENGTRPFDLETAQRYARAFKVDVTWLLAMSSGPVPHKVPDQPPARSVDGGETVEIVRLDLSLPMGTGATIDDYVEEEPVVFDLGYIRGFTRTPTHRLALARGIGDSMFPTLLPYDTVWIDGTQTALNQSDRVWAVSINGAAAIKRLRPLKGGRVLVISDNPSVENYEVEADEVRIGGRIIRFERDL